MVAELTDELRTELEKYAPAPPEREGCLKALLGHLVDSQGDQ